MNEDISSKAFYSRIQEKLESLSKMERKTAECMAENQDKLIYASITELAELAGTSEATVTRVCTKLGYSGFQALKVSVARELVSQQEKIHEDLKADSPPEMIIDKIFSSAIHTLTMTRKALDGKAVAGSIDALCRARRIVVIGNGNSGAIALDAQHKFLRIGLNVSAYTDDHMQMIAVVSMTKDDVLIAISHSGSSRDVAEAMQVAKENGATGNIDYEQRHLSCLEARRHTALHILAGDEVQNLRDIVAHGRADHHRHALHRRIAAPRRQGHTKFRSSGEGARRQKILELCRFFEGGAFSPAKIYWGNNSDRKAFRR